MTFVCLCLLPHALGSYYTTPPYYTVNRQSMGQICTAIFSVVLPSDYLWNTQILEKLTKVFIWPTSIFLDFLAFLEIKSRTPVSPYWFMFNVTSPYIHANMIKVVIKTHSQFMSNITKIFTMGPI